MKHFEGRIEHNRDTIRSLFKAEYDTYEMRKVIIRFLIGAVLIIAGLAGGFSMAVQGMMLMLGCWLIVSRDFPAKCRADRALESRKAELPVITSSFYEDHVELDGEGHMSIRYEQFRYLVEEKGFYFLFMGRDSACMIDGKTIKPDSPETFKAFVAEKTKLEWKETTSWLNMSLMDLFRALKSGVDRR